MNSKLKKPVALLLILAMIFTTAPFINAGPAFAAQTATISSDEDLTAEAGSTLTVPVYISGNPGVCGIGLNVVYDADVLTPQAVEKGEIAADGTSDDTIETSKDNSFKIYWAKGEDMTADGTLFNITFKVSDYAEGSTNIELSPLKGETFNEDFEDVTLNCSPVSVNVTAKASTVTTLKGRANQSVNAGEEIAIPVLINNVDKAASVAFDLKYDAEVFGEPVKIEDGLGACSMSGSGGQIHIEAGGIDTSAASGTLCTLTFKAADYTSGNYVFDLASETAATEDFRIAVVNTHAEENAVVYGKNVTLDGSDLSVDVGIKNNHGIAAFRIYVNYDKDVLTPVTVTQGAGLAGSFAHSAGEKDGTFNVLWFNSDNFTKNDTLFTVKFTVAEGAPETTQIGLDYKAEDTCDELGEDVILEFEAIDAQLSEPADPDQEAADAVEAVIEEMDPTDEESVAAARAAYEALTDAQKALVDEEVLKKLTDAEAAIAKAEADKAAAAAVEKAINEMDPEDPASVEAARAAYEALTDDQKALVDAAVLEELTDAEADIQKAKADKAAADAVVEAINEMDESDPDSVAAARTAYNSLTDDQKALVDADALEKLTAAEAAIEKDELDKAAAAAAEKAINDMDPSDPDSVAAARAAYDGLTDDQKALVNADVLKKLTDAEENLPQYQVDISTLLDSITIDPGEWDGGRPYCPFSRKIKIKGTDTTTYLYEGKDYTAEYLNNTDAGTGTVIVTGIGNYKGTKEMQFTIKPLDMDWWSEYFTITPTQTTYNGKVRTPALKVTDTEEYTYPVPTESDYDLSCATDRRSVGSHEVAIDFKGNYEGQYEFTFKINPKGTKLAKLKKGKKSMTVKWKKQTARMPKARITGYQIRYSLKSSMKKSKMVKVKGYKKTSKKIKKLKSKKKYYVQIRTYTVVKGKAYYSPWSKKKAVKVR